MEVESEKQIVTDCELDRILSNIRNDPSSTLASKAVDFLNKLVYFDLSNGIEGELCHLIISRWSVEKDPKSALTQKKDAKDVMQILCDNNAIHEMKITNSKCVMIKMCPNLQDKILEQHQHQQKFSFIIDLANSLKSILMGICGAVFYKSDIFHIHKRLKGLGWPGDSMKLSVCIVAQLLNDDIDTVVMEDIIEFFNASNRNLNEIDWLTVQMVQIYQHTISKSRKVLQPSDTICIKDIDGRSQDIRLDNYGSWMLNQIRIHSESGVDCDALTSVAEQSLERLQKHARFCSEPDEITLEWIVAYSGSEWHSFNRFAALACYQTDDWLPKLCRAYIRKLGQKVECCEESVYSLKNSYLSWVCLRDLVKASRIQDEIITALSEDEGLQFLNMNFLKCAKTLESKEYFLKYQAQTVIEMLTPFLVKGRSEIVAKLLKMQSFWSFVTLVLHKHPFTSERYDLHLENDLLCACEVYLNLLVAVCNRKDDAITNGFLLSFLIEDFLQAFTTVIRGATEFVEPRQRHTCAFYLFTILFTIFDILKSNEVIDVYISNEDIRKEIEEYSGSEDTNFDVPDGCLREYRMYIKSFCDLYSHDSKFANVICLIRKMLKVPEKYDWESEKE